MKQLLKKIVTFALVLAMVVTTELVVPQNTMEVQAASTVKWNQFNNSVVTYKPGDGYATYWDSLNISGCTKASQIKKLKSSNKNIKVFAKDGYIRVEFGKKAAKTTITCTVNNVKLKTTYTVKKYSTPVSSMKIGKTNLTSKYKTTDAYRNNKTFKNQKLDIKMKSGWKITSVSVWPGNGSNSRYTVNKSSFSKKINLKGNGGYVYVYCYNSKTKVYECIEIR